MRHGADLVTGPPASGVPSTALKSLLLQCLASLACGPLLPADKTRSSACWGWGGLRLPGHAFSSFFHLLSLYLLQVCVHVFFL